MEVNARKKQADVASLFDGKNVTCRNRPLRLGKSSCDSSTIYRGTWKGIPNQPELKSAIKRVKKTDCMDHWDVVVDWHQSGSLNHTNVLKVFGFEEDVTDWRLVNNSILEIFFNTQKFMRKLLLTDILL
jgi:hypothetical protein